MKSKLALRDIIVCILYLFRQKYDTNIFNSNPRKIQAFFYGLRDKFPVLKGYLSFGDTLCPWSQQLAISLKRLESSYVITRSDFLKSVYVINPFLSKIAENPMAALTVDEKKQIEAIVVKFAIELRLD